MKFQDEIKAHLANYKTTHFKGLGDGIWKGNKKSYPHILPEKKWFDNLLPKYKIELKDYIENKKEFKLHSDFHHLNSSQAMCLNMFYPLLKEKKLDLIIEALGIENDSVNYNSVCFEKKSEIETNMGSRPTYFDFFFSTINGKQIYFEIKYTEQEFGKAKQDKDHIDKYEFVYKKECSAIEPKYSDCNSFLSNYQLMRNLINIKDNSYVVFLFPTKNKRINKQSEFAKSNLIKSGFKQNIINLTWEHLLGFIDSINLYSDKLGAHMVDFKEKYRIDPIRY